MVQHIKICCAPYDKTGVSSFLTPNLAVQSLGVTANKKHTTWCHADSLATATTETIRCLIQ